MNFATDCTKLHKISHPTKIPTLQYSRLSNLIITFVKWKSKKATRLLFTNPMTLSLLMCGWKTNQYGSHKSKLWSYSIRVKPILVSILNTYLNLKN